MQFSDSLTIPPFHLSWQGFLLVHIHVQESIRESNLWVCPCFSSSALSVLFVLFVWFERWKEWSNSCSFVGFCSQDFFKTVHSILEKFPSIFFSMSFVIAHVVHLYSCMDKATARKKSCFILLDWSDFNMNCQLYSMPLLDVWWHHFQ